MRYLAEFYLPNGGSGLAELARRAEAGARRASGVSGADRFGGADGFGGAVRFVSAIYLPEDESCLAIYEAESIDSVQAAGALAGLQFDHVAPVSVCEAGPESESESGLGSGSGSGSGEVRG